jgi:hypothetical protein
MNGGSSSLKLLERMRNTQSGWGQSDFDRLLSGFGFDCREGKKHSIYSHKKFPNLRISVPRHNSLKEWVARDAVKLVDELLVNLKKEGDDNGESNKNA